MVTVTGTDTPTPAGAVHAMEFALQLCGGQAADPTRTVPVAPKFFPVSVTTVPPPAASVVGATLLMVGARHTLAPGQQSP